MSTLDDLNAGPGGMAGFVSALARRLRPVSRRDVLVGATVAATALATRPREYALTPVAAYATICGPGNTASSGWTVFCATVNKGVNTCPPGSFAAGWWKAADSSWCGGGYRYIVDCNATCSKCTTGCSDNMCDSRCWSCSCGTGSSATCDQRRVCCNAFRYGQCNTQIKCSGGVHCRVVSCRPPYQWTSCTTTSLVDNRTSEHSAPSLPQWGSIQQKYGALGSQGSYLKASKGPVSGMGDGQGTYVQYQGGVIISHPSHGTRVMNSWVQSKWSGAGGIRGALGYPTSDQVGGLRDGGWLQTFQTGAVTDSPKTTTHIVYGVRYQKWMEAGRENGVLGYPTGTYTTGLRGGGWMQLFQGGCVCDSPMTATQVVHGRIYTAWVNGGRENGPLGYPRGGQVTYPTGIAQGFEQGEMWAKNELAPRRVLTRVLAAWQAAGGTNGAYGWPVGETVVNTDGTQTCEFEGGTITA